VPVEIRRHFNIIMSVRLPFQYVPRQQEGSEIARTARCSSQRKKRMHVFSFIVRSQTVYCGIPNRLLRDSKPFIAGFQTVYCGIPNRLLRDPKPFIAGSQTVYCGIPNRLLRDSKPFIAGFQTVYCGIPNRLLRDPKPFIAGSQTVFQPTANTLPPLKTAILPEARCVCTHPGSSSFQPCTWQSLQGCCPAACTP
jgi:hypothetical protein